MIHNDYLNEDKKKQIEDFNRKIDEVLNDENFTLDGDSKFDSMYLEDIDNDPVFNPSVTYQGIEPMATDYGDMITDKQPDEDGLNFRAIDKYLNAELIFGISTNDKRWGHVIKHLWGLDGNPIGHAHSNPYFDTCKYELSNVYSS